MIASRSAAALPSRCSRCAVACSCEATIHSEADQERRERAFFALPIPEELLGTVSAAEHSLKKLAPELRWLLTAKLHLTLKFLGGVREADIDALASGLARIAGTMAPIPARVTGLSAFPNPRRARVLVLRLDDAKGALAELARALDALADSAGVERETRPFKAHVTLARARPVEDVRALVGAFAMPPIACIFDRARLYRSTLGRDGSTYDVLCECELGAARISTTEP